MSWLPDAFLDRAWLERVTKRKKAKAMVAALVRMKIPHMLDGDGWPLVLRAVIEPKLGTVDAQRQASGPDIAAAFGGKRRSA